MLLPWQLQLHIEEGNEYKRSEKGYYDGSLKCTLKKREFKVTNVAQDLRIVSSSIF